MSGKYELLLDLLVEGFQQGNGALFVTTNQGAKVIYGDVEDRLSSTPEAFRIVDCVSERQGGNDEFPPGTVEYVSSPADLTGIGIGVSEQLRELSDEDVDRIRVGFYSLSTLLMYAELETVFRFLHVLTGRVDSIGGLGVFTIDPSTHDESTVNTLKQLFDGMVEIRENDGGPEVRVVGVPNASSGWMPRH